MLKLIYSFALYIIYKIHRESNYCTKHDDVYGHGDRLMYMVVIKYMLYVAICIGIWIIVISIHLTGNVYSATILCSQYMY